MYTLHAMVGNQETTRNYARLDLATRAAQSAARIAPDHRAEIVDNRTGAIVRTIDLTTDIPVPGFRILATVRNYR